MAVFGEGVSVFTALEVPDLGDFILFSLASRCLSASCRTSFESQIGCEFPTVNDLFTFVRSRIAVLERVQGVAGKLQSVHASRPKERPVTLPPKYSRKMDRPSPTALVSAAGPVQSPTSHALSCKYCNNSRSLDVCRKFRSLSADERTKWARVQRICFSCLSSDHWAHRCTAPTKCAVCSRRHHTLLHKDVTPSHEVEPPVTPTSILSGLGSPSVVLGTALVHTRDRSGSDSKSVRHVGGKQRAANEYKIKLPRSGIFSDLSTDSPSLNRERKLFKSVRLSLADAGACNDLSTRALATTRGLSNLATKASQAISYVGPDTGIPQTTSVAES